jgi:SAM-dependent methyltransferase
MDTAHLLELPFDQYQRYTAVTQVAEQIRDHLGRARLCVLDVGGYFRMGRGPSILPLVHFLPQDQVFVIDVVDASMPNYSRASGLSLPFGDRAFDLVVSCDTLEHIGPGNRLAFLSELLRVADRYVMLAAPFDSELNRQAERILYQYITSQGRQQDQLEEHLKHGLPCIDTLRAYLAERGLASVDFADGYVHNWLVMMLLKHSPGHSRDFHRQLDRYYNLYFSPGDRREPAYRHVFVIAQAGGEALLADIGESFRTTTSPPTSPALGFAEDLIELLKLSQPEVPAGLDAKALERENARLRRLVERYEQGHFIRLMRWLKIQRSRLRKGHPSR